MTTFVFVTGLGTTKPYYEPLIAHLGCQDSSHVFELDDENIDDLSCFIDQVAKAQESDEKICVCAFSISCYPVLELAIQRNDIRLFMVDPPDLEGNPLAELVVALPFCVLWAWDNIIPRILKYHVLAWLGGYSTPGIVDWKLASMSIFKIRSMIYTLLYTYRTWRWPDRTECFIVVIRGSDSKYKSVASWLQSFVVPVNADHHMIYNNPGDVAGVIRRVLTGDEKNFSPYCIKQSCLEV